MTDLEKLLELIAIGAFFSRSADAEKCAVYLIANGVAPVVHGRWIPPGGNAHIMYYCSVCGHTGFSHMKYCPNCGAKMDGGADA